MSALADERGPAIVAGTSIKNSAGGPIFGGASQNDHQDRGLTDDVYGAGCLSAAGPGDRSGDHAAGLAFRPSYAAAGAIDWTAERGCMPSPISGLSQRTWRPTR